MFRALIVSLVVVVAASTARADDVPCPAGANCSVYVPSGWKKDAAAQGSQALLIAVSPDDKAGLLYTVVEAKNFDAALGMIDAILGKVVKDAKVEKGGKLTVNGIPALGFTGSGKSADDGKAVSLAAVILQPNPTHVLFAIAMTHNEVKAKYKAEFDKALAGIKKQ